MQVTTTSRELIDLWPRTPRSIASLSSLAPLHRDRSLAAFIINIAESNNRYAQVSHSRALTQMDLPLTELESSGCLDSAATPRKRRLAIVSTYDELCGIAAFTRSLVRIFEDDFDLEVFDLDQFLLCQTDRRSRRRADGYFRAICARLAEFDIVNLQLEFGILGGTRRDSLRRLRWLCEAAPQFTVTFHTVPRRQPIDWEDVFGRLSRLRIVDAIDVIGRPCGGAA
jgi:hypothetical protein